MYRYRWSTLKCQTIEPDDGGHLLKWPVVYTQACASHISQGLYLRDIMFIVNL